MGRVTHTYMRHMTYYTPKNTPKNTPIHIYVYTLPQNRNVTHMDERVGHMDSDVSRDAHVDVSYHILGLSHLGTGYVARTNALFRTYE